MKQEIKIPKMGESITEAVIGQIFRPSGSSVKAQEEILELETDKVNQVIYAPAAGVLTLTVKPEEVVKIDQVIGSVDSEGSASAPPETKKPPKESPKPALAASARGTKADFLAELSQPKQTTPPPPSTTPPQQPSSPPPSFEDNERESRQKMPRIRRIIAQKLVEAKQTTAMLTTFNEVDMTQVIALRAKYKEAFTKRYQARLGFMSFFIKAVISALKAYPELNSFIEGEELVQRHYYDIGVAVGTDRGLIVPVVRECDRLSFGQLEQSIENLAKKAREGGLQVEELSGGSFTITNGGVYGSLLSTPILNPPQSGILGMHKIQERPIALEGTVVIRPMMYLALSYDHRIVDGKGAVGFLVHIKEMLEDPARFVIEV